MIRDEDLKAASIIAKGRKKQHLSILEQLKTDPAVLEHPEKIRKSEERNLR